LQEWQDSLHNLNEERVKLAKGLHSELDDIADSVNGISSLLDDLKRLPALKGNELLDTLPVLRDKVLDNTYRYLKLFEAIQTLFASLAKRLGTDVLQDLSATDGFLV
jgi:hypothetical protein